LNREYLDDYSQREIEGIYKLRDNIKEGAFTVGTDKFPRNNRFIKIKEPVAVVVGTDTINWNSIWTQVPFSGSLLLLIHPCEKHVFEELFFKIEEIPRVIDFVKETGRLQIVLNSDPVRYEGLDYLDPIFKELNPPFYHMIPLEVFAKREDIAKSVVEFNQLASVNMYNIIKDTAGTFEMDSRILLQGIFDQLPFTYAYLKAWKYSYIEELQNLLIDDPITAYFTLSLIRDYIVDPKSDLRSTIHNSTFERVQMAQALPKEYRPRPFFPVEIGKFLVEKLTYAPRGLRACNQIIDNYEDYDLRKVQLSLNEAITKNNPDLVDSEAHNMSEILENVWNDTTIPNRIEGIRVGVPVSVAAIGSVAGAVTSGPAGALVGAAVGNFLTKIGIAVGQKTIEKLFDQKAGSLTEKIAKIGTENYQANIYDFKKRYKGVIKS
jgi:hypothetical protein